MNLATVSKPAARLPFLAMLLLLLLQIAPASAVELRPGDIVATDHSLGAVIRIDPLTGDRTILSSNSIGSGPVMTSPRGVAVEAGGSLLVADYATHSILRVDPATGDRTAAGSMAYPLAVALDRNGAIFASGAGKPRISKIDRVTGSTLKSFELTDISVPRGITFDNSGRLLVTNGRSFTLFEIDLNTEAATPFSSSSIGSGPSLKGGLNGIATDASGTVLVPSPAFLAILAVDFETGDRAVVSDFTTGAGMAFSYPVDIALEQDGQLLVSDHGLNAIFRVDPVSGDRTILSGAGVGSGPEFESLRRIAVVPTAGSDQASVPEPSTLLLLIAGLLAARCHWRERPCRANLGRP